MSLVLPLQRLSREQLERHVTLRSQQPPSRSRAYHASSDHLKFNTCTRNSCIRHSQSPDGLSRCPAGSRVGSGPLSAESSATTVRRVQRYVTQTVATGLLPGETKITHRLVQNGRKGLHISFPFRQSISKQHITNSQMYAGTLSESSATTSMTRTISLQP